jgi:hypothetical protein
MSIFLKRTVSLEAKIEQFLDDVANAGLLFNAGIRDYLDGELEQFNSRLEEIKRNESDADSMRREIRYNLYKKMLIPESRGDVLGLLETTDNVIDTAKKVMGQFNTERPRVRDFLHDDFIKLADASSQALDNLVKADRAFFNNNDVIQDYIHKVHFHEHEADQLEEKIKRRIFDSDEIPELAEKLHLRDFVTSIASLSDQAEDVTERLSVYSIKRSV